MSNREPTLFERVIDRLESIFGFHGRLERKIMTIAEDLKAASEANAAAIAGLTANVDALIALTNDIAAKLAALVAANGSTVSAADVQSVIDSLNAGAAAAVAESAKVADAIAADTPAA